MNLQTQIDQILSKLANCTKAEEYYYWTLALNELRKAHYSTGSTNNMTLLTPSTAIASTPGLYMSSILNSNNSSYGMWHLFTSGLSYLGGSAGWWAIHFDFNCVIKRYIMNFGWDGYWHPGSWTLEVCKEGETTNGGDGDKWIVVDEQANLSVSNYDVKQFDVASPAECQWARLHILSAYANGSNQNIQLSGLSMHGEKID